MTNGARLSTAAVMRGDDRLARGHAERAALEGEIVHRRHDLLALELADRGERPHRCEPVLARCSFSRSA